ncbi:MAG: hypothetical protein ACK5XN_32640 [Bacteroidota bacterium]|jgi:hypothetical protein
MSKKQTAVDYLVKELSAILGPLETKPMQDLLMVDAINKAKQMEKEQIMDAWYNGSNDGSTICSQHYNKPAQQYYNKTYGEEN